MLLRIVMEAFTCWIRHHAHGGHSVENWNVLVTAAGKQAVYLARWSQSVVLGEVQDLPASPATKGKKCAAEQQIRATGRIDRRSG